MFTWLRVRRVLSIGALATTALAPVAAHAGWLEARSKHFRVYSRWDEKTLRTFVVHLEQLDGALRIWHGKPDEEGAASNPMTIFVPDDMAAVQALAGDKSNSIGGFYIPRATGSVAFTPRSSGDRPLPGQDANLFSPEVVLYHEYGHHFLLGNFAMAYPAWFSEGYAEVISTATFEDGVVKIGNPANHRGSTLFEGKALSMEQLFTPMVGRVSGEDISSLYARGWLLAHYILFDSERRKKFSAYLVRLNAGVPSVTAAKQAFGDLKALDNDVAKYLRSRLPAVAVTTKQIGAMSIAIQAVTPGADAMMMPRMRSEAGVNDDGARKVFAEAKDIAAHNPSDALAQGWFAEMAYDAKEDAAAEQAADRALAADPKSIQALLYKARVHLRRAAVAKPSDPKLWEEARSWILKANSVDSDNAATLSLYYDSFTQQGSKPSQGALAGLQRAFELVPQDPGLRFSVARQYLIDGNVSEARAVLRPLAYDPHSRPNNQLTQVLVNLDSGMTGPAALAAFEAAEKAAKDKAAKAKEGRDKASN